MQNRHRAPTSYSSYSYFKLFLFFFAIYALISETLSEEETAIISTDTFNPLANTNTDYQFTSSNALAQYANSITIISNVANLFLAEYIFFGESHHNITQRAIINNIIAEFDPRKSIIRGEGSATTFPCENLNSLSVHLPYLVGMPNSAMLINDLMNTERKLKIFPLNNFTCIGWEHERFIPLIQAALDKYSSLTINTETNNFLLKKVIDFVEQFKQLLEKFILMPNEIKKNINNIEQVASFVLLRYQEIENFLLNIKRTNDLHPFLTDEENKSIQRYLSDCQNQIQNINQNRAFNLDPVTSFTKHMPKFFSAVVEKLSKKARELTQENIPTYLNERNAEGLIPNIIKHKKDLLTKFFIAGKEHLKTHTSDEPIQLRDDVLESVKDTTYAFVFMKN